MRRAELRDKMGELRDRMKVDPDFQARMDADPKTVIQSEVGVNFPADMDNAAIRDRYPQFFALEEVSGPKELNDRELESVAGGTCSCSASGCACVSLCNDCIVSHG